MKICRSYNCLIAVSIILSLSTFSCGMKHDIKCRVIDAETEKPIKGAVVNIEWYKHKLWPPIPLGSHYELIARYEAVTDSEGYFKITKHLNRKSDMCVYRKGYICWNDELVFNPEETDPPYIHKRNKPFSIKSGMIFKLKPFKRHYSRFEHGSFISAAITQCRGGGPEFIKEAMTELKFYRNEVERKRGIK